jgi:Zn-dependent M28 family amino/carboxypeptidase
MKLLKYLLFFILVISCKQKTPYQNHIKDDVIFLSSDSLEGRETGTQGEVKAGEYIKKRFIKIGLQPLENNNYFQNFTFKPKTNPHQEISFSNQKNDSTITGKNIIGYIDNQAKKTIIIGAHYDHLGYGNENSLHRGEKNLIHNGADDNASGVAMMIDLASKLRVANKNNNYLFIAFSGEEIGLLGSNYYTKNAIIKMSNINYMINMDMVGRLNEDTALAIYGLGTSPIFKQTINANNTKFKIIQKESGVGPSDHTSFYLNDIPVLHFFTGQHEDYHKPSDDYDKINFEGMDIISNYIFDIISDLNDNEKLSFTKTINESEGVPKFKVSLGVVPDYLFDGEGMRIDGVTENRPAQIAGLLKGDVVIKIGEYDVKNMMGYMKALSKFEKGNTTTVSINRKGDKIIKKITF